MKRRHRPFPMLVAAGCLLALAGTLTPAAVAQGAPAAWVGPTVRILLQQESLATTIRVEGPHEVRSVRGVQRAGAGLAWPVTLQDGILWSGGSEIGPFLELVPEDGTVRHDEREYRGALRLEATDGALRVINVLGLESYLRGVVPSEMSASWPLEALKAQAVAARSYTLASLDPSAPFDLCATDRCQVYRGTEVEDPRSDRAVLETEGIVISYGGVPAAAYYHSDSGGTVASAQEVWGRALPYLPSRADVATVSPHRDWRATIEPARLAAALAAEGLSVGTPTALVITARSGSGRAATAVFRGSGGEVQMQGPALTRVLRDVGLKSTRIQVLSGLTVRGDGWGHGVGMSQYGARTLAAQGVDYGRILAFYYPGVGLQQRIYRSADMPAAPGR